MNEYGAFRGSGEMAAVKRPGTVSPGELHRAIAEITGEPAASIAAVDRALVLAGLRAKHGRGWASPRLGPTDGARVTAGVIGSRYLKDAAEAVANYMATRPERRLSTPQCYRLTEIAELRELDAGHSFLDALEALIRAFTSEGSLAAVSPRKQPRIEVIAQSRGAAATVRITGNLHGEVVFVTYRHRVRGSAPKKADKPRPDLELFRRITERTFAHLAAALN